MPSTTEGRTIESAPRQGTVDHGSAGRPASRAAIVGDASLAGRCAGISLERGLDVVVLATDDAGVREQAEALGIPVVAGGDLTAALLEHRVDVLLSVANLRVLPSEVLDAVTTAINFHDGPLPAYAGLNVTSWAILAGETHHAVTWHRMVSDVDGGEIAATQRFEILPDETAFSLNARCYEAALHTFGDVVASIVDGSLTTQPQPDGERHIYGRYDRPIVFIGPDLRAIALDRTVRALSLGNQIHNPLGVVRFVGPSGHLTVTRATVTAPAGLPVGTVGIDAAGVRFATDAAELLLEVERPNGDPVDPSAALTELGMHAGDAVQESATLTTELASVDRALARSEAHWRSVLNEATDADIASFFDTAPIATIDRPLPTGTDIDDVLTAVHAWCWRLTGVSDLTIGVTDPESRALVDRFGSLLVAPRIRFSIDEHTTWSSLRMQTAHARTVALERGPFLADLLGRDPLLRGTDPAPTITVDLETSEANPPAFNRSTLHVGVGSGRLVLTGPDRDALERIADHLETMLVASLSAEDMLIAALPMLGSRDRSVIDGLNRTQLSFDRGSTVDALIDRQIELGPDQPAITAAGHTITYAELGQRAASLAATLVAAGVRPGDRVGIALGRSTDLVVSVLAVHRCGAAYVPLDPQYPIDRLRHMVSDSGTQVVVARPDSQVLRDVDGLTFVDPHSASGEMPPEPAHTSSDLCYVIYTSGSTGTPKGVMLEHRNVVNFFAAMNAVIDHDPPGVWLAVTSLSFDISVLELLWTLTHGFHVVVRDEIGATVATRAIPGSAAAPVARPITMSLFYFAAGQETADDGYRLLLESARWADAAGFEAVWTPERHFHEFGGAYPNPSVTGAALAVATERIAIRAGSVVAPLHAPARIAEEWAVVDNLAGGRVGISFAPGWQPNDFVLNPAAYAGAREGLTDTIDVVRRLWRGESVDMPGPDGSMVPVRTLPSPVQPELPVWLTSAGTPATFERAGTQGFNLLTHLLGQSIEQLAANLELYRSAWRRAGHPGEGQVTLMLHSYLHTDPDLAREIAYQPMKQYLSTATGLIKNMASAFPTFRKGAVDADEAFRSLTPSELDQLLDMAATRYLETSGLFGTADDAYETITRCAAIGVDEIACLIDFGVPDDDVLDALPLLGEVFARLQNRAAAAPTADADPVELDDDGSFAGLVRRYGVTHLQCTPSLATMLTADPFDRAALGTIDHVMLGGEALPAALAADLRSLLPHRLTNMYGPTETTIWSLVHELDEVSDGPIPIGRPVGNNTVAVLDARGNALPLGAFGELFIGGEGVARGYHARPELTAERFVQHPRMGRIYATGDVARIRPDGVVEFAGRTDHQVKIRGHRIELGEIETVLDAHPDVLQSVVVAHARSIGDPQLIAFIVSRPGTTVNPETIRSVVGAALPDAYVPSRVLTLDAFPLTPNGKTDRSRLIRQIDDHLVGTIEPVEQLSDDDEQLVAEIWISELGRRVGRDDNFFEIGGNSLLAVAVYRHICAATDVSLALTDVFRYPTVRSFAAHVASRRGRDDESTDSTPAPAAASDRGARRRRALSRRAN